MKKCSKCKIIKEYSEFYTDKTTISGYQSNCIICKKYNYKLNRDKYKNNYIENNDRLLDYQNKYYKENKKDRVAYQVKYNNYRKKTDSFFKFKTNMRSRISSAFRKKYWNKNSSTQNLIGESYLFVSNYIENKFTKDMTWENYGKWHIDHILPLCSASTEEDLLKLFHYTNLQPLWAKDNLSKGGKY